MLQSTDNCEQHNGGIFMRKKCVKIISVLMVVVILMGCGKVEESEALNGNLVNESLITKQGEWLYYSSKDGIYKSTLDGTKTEKLCDETGISIIVKGNWVYFKSEGIFRVKTDGKKLEQVSDMAMSGTFRIIEDKIFFSSEYKMELDGSKCEQIYDKNSASGLTINIIDDWIYFYDRDSNDKDHIYKMKTDGSDLQAIFDGRADYMIVDGEWIYFQNYSKNKALYKMKTDGSDLQLMVDTWIGALNVADGWVYYVDHSEGLYRIKTDGSEKQFICSDTAYDLHIIQDYIYYIINGDTTKRLYRMKTDGSECQVFCEL